MTIRRIGQCSAIAMVLSGAFAVPAPAQDIAGFLEQVIVTAQRRAEDLQQVPVSVSTLKGERFESIFTAGEDIRALSARIPSLYAESSNGRFAPRFYIRGLGNSDFDLAASQPVSIIMDEVVLENVALKSFPLFDIAQVEVLRGPQGTLFGRNTPAGIVKFDTAKPTDELDGFGTISYGSRNTVNAQAAVGGPLIDGKLSARISGLYQHRDDYVNNAFTGENDAVGGFDDIAGRIQLLFTPSETFRALVNFHIRDLDGTATLFRANIIQQGSDELIPGFDRETVFFDEGDNNPQEYNSWGASARLEADFDGFSVVSITAYETTDGRSLGDIDGGFVGPNSFFDPANPPAPPFFPDTIPFPSVTQDGIDDLDQITQEIRFASDTDGPFSWQFGGFFFDSEFQITTMPFFVDPSVLVHENTAWAVFGQATYDITETTTFTGGLRFTDDEKDLTVLASPIPSDPVNVQDSKLSWDFSLNHQANENVNLYVRHARGFRGPSIQGRDVAFFGAPSVAQSETSLSFEGGVKSELFDRRARVNASVYYFRTKDLQLSAVGGDGNTIQLVNSEKGVGWGFEIDTEFVLTENLNVTVGFSYNNTELQDPNLLVAPCGSGLCTPLDPAVGGFVSVDGNPFPNAPELIFNFSARYGQPVGNDGEVFVFTDWFIQGETNFLLYETEEFRSSGDLEGGLKIGYLHNNGQYEIAFFARNITNEENLKGGIDFNNLTGFLNEPRTFGVSLTARIQ